jgi:hypothetical protein
MKITKTDNPKKKDEMSTGFIGGLNLFQDETSIKPSELTEAKNVMINVDGLSPRGGTLNYGTESGDRVLGAFAYYNSDGTRELLRFTKGENDKLQKYVSGTPTDIGTVTYDADSPMNFVQADNKAFIFNGTDNLTYYDGSTITEFSALDTPSNVAISNEGTGGSTTYSYRISAFNATGETVASASVNTTTGNATLNATNYNEVTWDAVTDAVGYNVYGRYATGLGETFMQTVYVTTYNDKGSDDPSLSILPPTSNSTEGIIGSMPIFAISRIFTAGISGNTSRLAFSGTGEKVGHFSTPEFGAGGVDVFKNDGSAITGIIGFQGGVIVFKENAVYKFSFTADGFQQLEEIVKGFGACSHRAIKHVENDIIFPSKKDGRLAFYSLGNQENYVATVLRTNELSIKVEPLLEDVNFSELDNSASAYFRNLYMCAVTKENSSVNDRVWVLDTRFGAWVYWEGMSINSFVVYNDGTDEKLYYCDDESGYLVEMFRDAKNDNGVAIDVRWATKSFNQGQFNKEKRYHNPTFQFKNVNTQSNIKGYIYTDGIEVTSDFTVSQQNRSGGGFGAIIVGETPWGDSPSTVTNTEGSSDIPVEVYGIFRARSIKYYFISDKKNADFKFLSVVHTYSINSKRLSDSYRVYPN